MESVNLVLNLFGWFLWAGAFVFPRYAVRSSQPLTLLSTLRQESTPTYGRFFLLGGLVLLLGLRALAYWNFIPEGAPKPAVEFGLVSVSYLSERLVHMLIYSFSSFVIFLYGYYVLVFGLSITCRQRTRVNSIENLINQQLGSAAYWHPGLKVLALGCTGAGLWIGFGLLSLQIGVLPEEWTLGVLFMQSPIVAASFWTLYLVAIMAVIGLYLLNSYVYLGEKVVWKFIDETAKFYLSGLRQLPLVFGRIDLAPMLGLLLYWLLYRILEAGLQAVFERLPG